MELHLPEWLQQVGRILFWLIPVVLFAAWCLWGINWRRAWPILAAGGWAPLLLVAGVAGYVWSRVFPSTVSILGVLPVPNLLWQLGCVAALVGVMLLCGWLQTRSGWEPREIELTPSDHNHDHAHGHDHASAAPNHLTAAHGANGHSHH